MPQYRKGAPSGFGILRYKGTPKGALPSDPVPQSKEAADKKWKPEDYMSTVSGRGLGRGLWRAAGMAGHACARD
jgi:hypothetical protein